MSVFLANIALKTDTILDSPGLSTIASYLRINNISTNLYFVQEDFNDIEFLKLCKENKPLCIGFSVYYQGVYFLKKIISEIKNFSNAYIFVGGYVASYYSEELLTEIPGIDCVIRGEGEIITLNVVQNMINNKDFLNIKGISYLKDSIYYENPKEELINNLDILPFQARDFMNTIDVNMVSLSTSRGCYRNCSFCSSQNFWREGKQIWRGRSAKLVVDEIEFIMRKYNKNNFDFLDASFEDGGGSFSRLMEIAKEIIQRNLSITYIACFRVDSIIQFSDEIFATLIDSGLRSVFLGVESFNSEDLMLYKKGITEDEIESAINILRCKKINVEIGFIHFNPFSTLEGLRKNLFFLHKYGYTSYLVTIKLLRVFKGCVLYERVKKEKLVKINTSPFITEYEFKDKMVGNLYEAIKKFRIFDEKRKNFFKYMQYFSIYFFEHMSGIKENYSQKIAEINEIEIMVKCCLEKYSEINYKWSFEMILLAEKGYLIDSLFEFSKERMYSKQTIKILDNLIGLQKRLDKLANTKDIAFNIY